MIRRCCEIKAGVVERDPKEQGERALLNPVSYTHLDVYKRQVIMDAESGKVIADMSGENKRQIVLRGGRGGKGNQHYATATMQVPKYAQPGQPAQEPVSYTHLDVYKRQAVKQLPKNVLCEVEAIAVAE